tara:strand:+ start:286 stop:621 length:336 start_codon:yes stop_codon:yes gene_type:complete
MNSDFQKKANFKIGEIVKHRLFSFRGVIFDVDPEFMNTEEWYSSIPADMRPKKDQPFYHLFAESEEGPYIAYVSQQNLLKDDSQEPCLHPQIDVMFNNIGGDYVLKKENIH